MCVCMYVCVYVCMYVCMQPWSARTYNFPSIPLTICNKEYSNFCSKQKGINQWHICACILNFTIYLEVLQCTLTQSYYIRKPNEPQYQENTFLQENSWVTDLETCLDTNFAIDHIVSKIIERQSFYYPKVNENTLFTTPCCLWSPREFELFNGRSFYSFLLVQKPHVTK